jgi:flagellar motor protein MotB
MKLVGIISTAVLSLTLGAAAPAFAQQEQHDQQEEQKAKPAQDEKKAQPATPAKQEEKPAAQQEKSTKPTEKNAQQQEKDTKPEEKNAQQAKPGKQAQQAGGGRIPADKFKANFGQQHTFHVSQGDYSNHRFQYGGYSFGFVDAWPSNWLYTQNVYVIEINGVYYLCNASFPGVNLVLSFTP